MRANTPRIPGRLLIVYFSAAGAKTTATVLDWWMLAMLAMITYPEVQSRAQAELDAVFGRARTPTFADLQYLPYIRAMVKQALRWGPVGPLGFPHVSTEDDWYGGMFIPKDTVVIATFGTLTSTPKYTAPTPRTSTGQDFWMPMATSPPAHLIPKRKATSRTVLVGVSVLGST